MVFLGEVCLASRQMRSDCAFEAFSPIALLKIERKHSASAKSDEGLDLGALKHAGESEWLG